MLEAMVCTMVVETMGRLVGLGVMEGLVELETMG